MPAMTAAWHCSCLHVARLAHMNEDVHCADDVAMLG